MCGWFREEKSEVDFLKSRGEQLVEQAWDLYLRTSGDDPEDRAVVREILNQVFDIEPDNYSTYVLLGYVEMMEERFDEMERCFLKALDLAHEPHNEYTWDAVSVALNDNLEDYPRLARYLSKFFDRKPEFFVLKYLVGVYLELEEPRPALSAVRRYLTYQPDDKRALKLQKKLERMVQKS